MQRTQTVHRPRPKSDTTHNREHYHSDRTLLRHSLTNPNDNDLYRGDHPQAYEPSRDQHQTVRGDLSEYRNSALGLPDDHRGHVRAKRHLPTPHVAERRRTVIEEDHHRDANRQGAYSRLCGADEHAPAVPQQLPLRATNPMRQRSKSDAARPRSTPVDEREKRVTFNSRDYHYEFIKGERPMRDPEEYGASHPAHRESPPPPHSNLRAPRDNSSRRISHVGRSHAHSVPHPAPANGVRRLRDESPVERARKDHRHSHPLLATPEAQAYFRANPEAYLPPNLHDPTYDPAKAREQAKANSKLPSHPPSSFRLPFMPPETLPFVIPGYYPYPPPAKEKKSNPLARFKDKLIDITCEPDYPDVPSAMTLGKQMSVPRDEDGNPKLPWEFSSKSRKHDPRKYIEKERKGPMYVHELEHQGDHSTPRGHRAESAAHHAHANGHHTHDYHTSLSRYPNNHRAQSLQRAMTKVH